MILKKVTMDSYPAKNGRVYLASDGRRRFVMNTYAILVDASMDHSVIVWQTGGNTIHKNIEKLAVMEEETKFYLLA